MAMSKGPKPLLNQVGGTIIVQLDGDEATRMSVERLIKGASSPVLAVIPVSTRTKLDNLNESIMALIDQFDQQSQVSGLLKFNLVVAGHGNVGLISETYHLNASDFYAKINVAVERHRISSIQLDSCDAAASAEQTSRSGFIPQTFAQTLTNMAARDDSTVAVYAAPGPVVSLTGQSVPHDRMSMAVYGSSLQRMYPSVSSQPKASTDEPRELSLLQKLRAAHPNLSHEEASKLLRKMYEDAEERLKKESTLDMDSRVRNWRASASSSAPAASSSASASFSAQASSSVPAATSSAQVSPPAPSDDSNDMDTTFHR